MPKIDLASLFGESPFQAVKLHSQRVQGCIGLLPEILEAAASGNRARARELCERVVALETEADEVQNAVHERLVERVLLPVSKPDLVNLLEQQDSMADSAEEIAAWLTYRDMRLPEGLRADMREYLARIMRNCELSAAVVGRIDLLQEASFGGRDALTASRLVSELNQREDATKPVQVELTRKLLAAEPALPPVETMLWVQVIGLIAQLSKYADHTASAVRRLLHSK